MVLSYIVYGIIEEEMTPEEYIPDPKNPDWDRDF
jgi:hypothetical protein